MAARVGDGVRKSQWGKKKRNFTPKPTPREMVIPTRLEKEREQWRKSGWTEAGRSAAALRRLRRMSR